MDKYESAVRNLLRKADIEVNGSRDWDIQVHDKGFYQRVLSQGSIGFGEAYMEGVWDVRKLDEFFTRVLNAGLAEEIRKDLKTLVLAIISRLFNRQSKKRAFEVGEKHYNLGNKLFELMLDKRMVYTCGYWNDAKTLEEAQEKKLELVCTKIGLKKGQKILDIGCGWGSFLKYAAEKYGARGVGITISSEQVKLAKENCKGLPIEIRLQDYRDLVKTKEKFDHIVSLGMFEHVGSKNYSEYFSVVKKILSNDGLFLLHTIGKNEKSSGTDPWINKYIFPNGVIPNGGQIMKASEEKLIMEDWHNFGLDYDKTLMAWNKNFQNSWGELRKSSRLDEEFKRMWEYYLMSCAASFRARKNQLWQIVFSKDGVKGGYKSVR